MNPIFNTDELFRRVNTQVTLRANIFQEPDGLLSRGSLWFGRSSADAEIEHLRSQGFKPLYRINVHLKPS